MKNLHHYIIILFCLLLVSCSDDSSTDGAGDAQADGQGGSLARFALVGDYLYTVDEESLRVFSLAEATSPEFRNETFVGFNIETIYAVDNLLYLGSRQGMYVYDVSAPENPLLLSEVRHFTACDPVVARDSVAYVTLHAAQSCRGTVNQMEIYDVSDHFDPILMKTITMDRPIGLGFYHDYLLVTDKDVVRIFDITDPFNPRPAGGIQEDGFDVIIREDHLHVIGERSLTQYSLDPSDVANPRLLSRIDF